MIAVGVLRGGAIASSLEATTIKCSRCSTGMSSLGQGLELRVRKYGAVMGSTINVRKVTRGYGVTLALDRRVDGNGRIQGGRGERRESGCRGTWHPQFFDLESVRVNLALFGGRAWSVRKPEDFKAVGVSRTEELTSSSSVVT